MELAVELYGVKSINDLDAGKYNIFQDVDDYSSDYVSSVSLHNGIITLENKNMSELANYKLVVERIENNKIVWQDINSTQSSCLALGWC